MRFVHMRKVVPAAVILVALLPTTPSWVLAQERVIRNPRAVLVDPSPPSSTSAIPIVRGRQGTTVPEAIPPRPDPPPRQLTTIEKNALLGDLGKIKTGMGSWEVTPANPIVPGRVAVHFLRPILVHPGPSVVASLPRLDEWTSEESFIPTPAVLIVLKPEALGRKYLLDCRVGRAQTYSIKIGSLEVPYAGSPLLLVYEALDSKDAAFRITGEGFAESNFGGWEFYGCEVSQVE